MLGREPGDYAKPGFFGDIHLDTGEDFGFFVQAAAIEHGKGRVVAFSDSTTLSNFSLFFPGRLELVLGTMAYLDRASTPLRHVPVLALALRVACACGLGMYRRGQASLTAVILLLGGAPVGTLVVRLSHASYALPEPPRDVPVMVFDRSISELVLPGVLTLDNPSRHGQMDTLFVAAQRLGFLPWVADRFLDGLARADTLVLTHPRHALDPLELEALARFVAQGGNLLVLDGLYDPGTVTDDILELFGMSIERNAVPSSVRTLDAAEQVAEPVCAENATGLMPASRILRPALAVRGGEPLLVDEDALPVFSVATLGAGRVGVFLDSASLSKTALGSRFSNMPSAEQRTLLDTAYFVLHTVARERARDPSAAAGFAAGP